MNPRTTLLLLARRARAGRLRLLRGGRAARRPGSTRRPRAKRLFPDVEAEDVEWVEVEERSRQAVRLERRDDALAHRGAGRLSGRGRERSDGLVSSAGRARSARPSSRGRVRTPSTASPRARACCASASATETTAELRLGRETPGRSQHLREARGPGRRSSRSRPSPPTRLAKSLADLRAKADPRLRSPPRWSRSMPAGPAAASRARDSVPAEAEGDVPGVAAHVAARGPRADEATRPGAPLHALDAPRRGLRRRAERGGAPERRCGALHGRPHAAAGRRGGRRAAHGPPVRRRTVTRADQRLVRGPEASLYTIRGGASSPTFPQRVVEYRFRRLVRLRDPGGEADRSLLPARVREIRWRSRAARGDAGWSSSPEATAPGKIARLVSELSTLDADDIVSDDAVRARSVEALELAPPNVILTVLGDVVARGPGVGSAAPRRCWPRCSSDASRGRSGSWRAPPAIEAVYRLPYALAEHVPGESRRLPQPLPRRGGGRRSRRIPRGRTSRPSEESP